VAMLEAMRDFIAADPPPAQANFTFERTTYWQSAEARFRSGGPTAPALLAALRLDASRCERVGEDELRAWYFARVAGTAEPADLDGWTRDAGFADADDFHRAVFAEYLVHGLADEARAAPGKADVR